MSSTLVMQENEIQEDSIFKICYRYLKNSIPYYWYTGKKDIAIAGFLATVAIDGLFLYMTVGSSVVILIFMLLMDKMIAIFLVLYLLFIRNLLPLETITNYVDGYILETVVFFIVAALLQRVIVNLIAKFYFNEEL